MSSYDNGGFDEWLKDSFGDLTPEQWASVQSIMEPHREEIDASLESFDPENMSWRDFRNGLWYRYEAESNKIQESFRVLRGEQPKRATPPPPSRWQRQEQAIRIHHSRGNVLLFAANRVEDGTWNVLALETPLEAALTGSEAILDHHAHELIGEGFASPEAADAVCDERVKRWRAGLRAKRCNCGPIETANKEKE